MCRGSSRGAAGSGPSHCEAEVMAGAARHPFFYLRSRSGGGERGASNRTGVVRRRGGSSSTEESGEHTDKNRYYKDHAKCWTAMPPSDTHKGAVPSGRLPYSPRVSRRALPQRTPEGLVRTETTKIMPNAALFCCRHHANAVLCRARSRRWPIPPPARCCMCGAGGEGRRHVQVGSLALPRSSCEVPLYAAGR
jgi:hypothetical protein